jgi:hypothetical protein
VACWKLWLPTLAAADAFTGLAADDARRVAAQCAWDLVLYGQLGAASVAMTNRAEAAASCWDCFDSAVPPERWTLTCADIATALCGVLRTSGASARCQPVC